MTQTIAQATTLYEELIQYRHILDTAPGYIFWKDKASNYIGGNQNAAHVLGLKKSCDISGIPEYETPWAAIIPKTAMQNIKVDQYIIETGNSFFTESNLGIKNAEGLAMVVRSEKKPLKDKNGKIVGILGYAIEITAQKKLEQELYQAQINLISHKFRLTQRELKCIDGLLLGKTAAEIAEVVYLSVRTVEKHLSNIKEKLYCRSKSALIAQLIRLGFKPSPEALLPRRGGQ